MIHADILSGSSNVTAAATTASAHVIHIDHKTSVGYLRMIWSIQVGRE